MLDAEIARWLESEKDLPPRSALTVDETREMIRGLRHASGTPPTLIRVDEMETSPGVAARLYWPKDDATLPILIYLHGGRFFSGNLESHDGVCRWLAQSTGCRVAAIDYRLAPEHPFPAAAEDAVRAAQWAIAQDVPVGIAGDSAGGNLAALAALILRSANPGALRCQILIYPMLDATRSLDSHREFATGYGPGSDDMERGWALYAGESVARTDARLSPLFAGDLSQLAPAFVLTAEYDSLRDEGEVYAERLREAGVEVVAARYSGTVHGFFGMPGLFAIARMAFDDVGHFVRAKMGVTEPDAQPK